MCKKSFRFVLLIFLLAVTPVIAAKKKKKAKSPEPRIKSAATIVGDAEKIEGLLSFHQTEDKIYLLLPDAMIGKDLGFVATRVKATGDFSARDTVLTQPVVARWVRRGKNMIFEKQNTNFRASPDSSMHYAVTNTFLHSPVYQSAVIPTSDQGQTLIDVTDMFGADLDAAISPGFGYAPTGKPTLVFLKAFPDNVVARVMYRVKQQGGGAPPPQQDDFTRFTKPARLMDPRFAELIIDYTIYTLPDDGFRPRFADQRVDGMSISYKDYSDVEAEDTAFRHVLLRWDLRKKDPSAELSEPVDPITFYLDKSVPAKWRPLMHEAGEWWNRSFEKVGLKNAVRIVDQPDGDFDPNDIRNSMIYWNLSDDLVFSGMAGPSIYDPRTGEVLKGNVYINGEFPSFALHRYLVYSWWRAPDPGQKMTTAANFSEWLREQRRNRHFCDRAPSFSSQIAFARLVLRSRGQLQKSPDESERYAREAFLELVAHEIGHALGFPHNWKASLANSWEDVKTGKLTGYQGKNQFGSSVMDYNPIYIAPKGVEQGDYFLQEVGIFDDLWVEYFYRPMNQLTAEQEAEKLDAIAARAEVDINLVYDGGEFNDIDPTSNSDDFGDDPLSFAATRLNMIYEEALPHLPKLVLEEGHDYNLLRQALDSAIFSVAMDYADMAARHVGGQVLLRRVANSKASPVDGPPPIQPLASETQRRALNILDEYLFKSGLFALPPEILSQLKADMKYDWNYPWRYVTDYNINNRIAGLYDSTLGVLLKPNRLARIMDNERRDPDGNPLTLPELFNHLADSAFGGMASGEELPADRRALQRMVVKHLIKLAVDPPRGVPAEASQVAAHVLRRIHNSLNPDQFQGYTGPHLEDLKLRISRNLNASVTLETGK